MTHTVFCAYLFSPRECSTSVKCTSFGVHMPCECADGQAVGGAAAGPKRCCMMKYVYVGLQYSCKPMSSGSLCQQARQVAHTSAIRSKQCPLSIHSFSSVLYIMHGTQCICSYRMANTYTVYVYAIHMLYTICYILYTIYAIYHILSTMLYVVSCTNYYTTW